MRCGDAFERRIGLQAADEPSGERRLGGDHLGHGVRRAVAPSRHLRRAHGSGGAGEGAAGSKASARSYPAMLLPVYRHRATIGRMDPRTALAELEAAGTEKNRAIYRRHGAGENQYGVSFKDLRAPWPSASATTSPSPGPCG